MDRPDWDDYFMNIAHVVKTRGNCSRRQVAALVVKDRRIISTGYNGTPRGVTNCFDGGCERCAGDAESGEDLSECICSHAEENAVAQAAFHGIALSGSTIYVTISPCMTCSKMLINSGIIEVVYEDEYHYSAQIKEMFKEAGVTCRQLKRS